MKRAIAIVVFEVMFLGLMLYNPELLLFLGCMVVLPAGFLYGLYIIMNSMCLACPDCAMAPGVICKRCEREGRRKKV